jgi:hypothetical protein
MRHSILITASGLLLAAQAVMAQPGSPQFGCTNRTLTGVYGFTVSGTAPSGPDGPVEQLAGVATTEFDGAGNFSQTDWTHGAISGSVVDRPGWGTYELNRDCSGTMVLNIQDLPFPIELRIVVVDGGGEVRSVVMAPAQNLITSNGKRVR